MGIGSSYCDWTTHGLAINKGKIYKSYPENQKPEERQKVISIYTYGAYGILHVLGRRRNN